MKLTQLSSSEFKLDSVEDFCLCANGNCMVLLGNSNDVTILELMNGCDTTALMPYSNKQIVVSQNKPISEVIKRINLVNIYENGTVEESQELSLDLIYTADCATEPLKAKVLQANIINKNNIDICCILTTYGYCEIYKKAVITEEWESLDTNLSNILITEIFPSKAIPSNMGTYDDLKTFVNKFIITCFAMSLLKSDIVIYLGTAAGYIICLKYNVSSSKFEEYCHLKTSLNRISYIVTCKSLILVGCEQGKVLLVNINFENDNLQELDYLWSKSDRMSCRKAIFTYNEDLKSYLVIFCKTAHVLAYRLNLEGAVLFSTTLFVTGIKITGIESISENEFLLTTIIGTVKYIKINNEELDIEEQMVDNDFDSANYQILGLAASSSKNLWSFLLYRNKDYVHQSRYSSTSAFLNVCKLDNQDSFVKLINLNIKTMDTTKDLLMAINLDIFNNMDLDKYMGYLNLEKINFPNKINDAFIQKLQIKIIITRKLALYQNIKYRIIKTQTKNDLRILEPVVQMLYIIGRLSYLKKINAKVDKLSKFQKLSIACMQLQFCYLQNNIVAINNNEEDNALHKTIDRFDKFLMKEFENNKFDMSNFANTMEYCMMCDKAITNFVKCEQEHEIKRCSISCTQLSLFDTIQCPHCYALARNDDAGKLQELFATDEFITCIYCRFLLKQDEF